MQPDYTPSESKRPRLKYVVYVIVALAIPVVSFWMTSAIFHAVTPSKVASSSSSPALNISAALAAYPNAISRLQTNYQQTPGTLSSMVHYQKPSSAYGIDVATSNALSFTAKSTTPADDTPQIQTQTISFFKSKDLTEQTSPKYSTPTNTYTTLVGASAVCQLEASIPIAGQVKTVSLSCMSQSDIDKEYSFIDQLVGLYEKANSKLSFTHASRNLVTSDNKSLSILRLSGGSSEPALLFAAVDNQWEYIAQLSDGPSAASNGKYVPSDELTAALKNPKYGDFLINNIQ